MPKVEFRVSLPLNLYYHLQLSCGTNPQLKNKRYQQEFSPAVPKDLCWDFYFAQDQYWFTQRFFIETLGRAQDLPSLEEGFAGGFEEYIKGELLPKLTDILRRAYSSYEPYWRRRGPELERIRARDRVSLAGVRGRSLCQDRGADQARVERRAVHRASGGLLGLRRASI